MAHLQQSIGSTLTGGIQDVSAILPLLGTEQCESHVGSALEGGYLYAAVLPLSIFGSLGVVKAGISILITSISIPTFILTSTRIGLSKNRWLGAKTLQNAGYQLSGTVAPLIAMDGSRYQAETRLLQILQEKHMIDNPEKLSVEWKSRRWNVMLFMTTVVGAILSSVPYIALLRGSTSWRPPTTHSAWLFPFLRTMGSFLATICCQYLIQSRVISIMKNRLLFMTIHRQLIHNASKNHTRDIDSFQSLLKWDENLPSEECLWNMQRLFSSNSFIRLPTGHQGRHLSIPMDSSSSLSNRNLSFEKEFRFIFSNLRALRKEHFPSPILDCTIMVITWTLLLISLPMTIAGYVGCFTLVSSSKGNGPLVWLGLEAVLSIIRILIWAWNPSFDEETGITVKLKLTGHRPLATTEKDFSASRADNYKPIPLFSHRRFLEWITPYTGPLDQFHLSQDVVLYFCLMARRERSVHDEILAHNHQACGSLMMTISDPNKQIAATISEAGGVVRWCTTTVRYNDVSGEMEAVLYSGIRQDHPWPTKEPLLFDGLEEYYKSILSALNRNDQLESPPIVSLHWTWNLLPKRIYSNNSTTPGTFQRLTDHDILYLDRGYEHEMKSKLVDIWSRCISGDMKQLVADARNDCHEVLADPNSEKAKWELTELDCLVTWEWTKRELALLVSSMKIEAILQRRMEQCIDRIHSDRKDDRLKECMRFEFQVGQRMRLEKERRAAGERMEGAMKYASERAERKGRSWKVYGNSKKFIPKWQGGQMFIDELWSSAIDGGYSAQAGVSNLDTLISQNTPWSSRVDDQPRLRFIHSFKQRFSFWDSQRENERQEMDATIHAIEDLDGYISTDHIDRAYDYPEPDREATRRFAMLKHSKSQGRGYSAVVYDVRGCDRNTVYEVIKKPTTRSIINVPPEMVADIPENSHILFLGRSRGEGDEPIFVQRNRNQWLDQQTSNSAIFYFTPDGLSSTACHNYTNTPIAHILLHLAFPSRIRLRLLHRADCGVSVSIQLGSQKICVSDKISQTLQLEDLNFDEFMSGRHELQIIPYRDSEDNHGHYCLRDILVEFT